MKKLYKVKLGKPTGGDNYFAISYGGEGKKIKSEYFVVAKSFNEAGRLVMTYVEDLISKEKSSVRVTECGLENLEYEINVNRIELITDELL